MVTVATLRSNVTLFLHAYLAMGSIMLSHVPIDVQADNGYAVRPITADLRLMRAA
jgi:hypothetical protein